MCNTQHTYIQTNKHTKFVCVCTHKKNFSAYFHNHVYGWPDDEKGYILITKG